jgi:hypothetical protein
MSVGPSMPPEPKAWYQKTWPWVVGAMGGLALLLNNAVTILEAIKKLIYPEIGVSLHSVRMYPGKTLQHYIVEVIVKKTGMGKIGPCRFEIVSSLGQPETWNSNDTLQLPLSPTERKETITFVESSEIPVEPLLRMECPDIVSEVPFGRGLPTLNAPNAPDAWLAVIGQFLTSTSLSKPEALAKQTAQAVQDAGRDDPVEILRGTTGGALRNIIVIQAASQTEAEDLASKAKTSWNLGIKDALAIKNQGWKKVADCTKQGCTWH